MAEEDAKQKLRVTMVNFDKSDQWVITASLDLCIRVWNCFTGELIRILQGHKKDAYVVESHPLDSRVIANLILKNLVLVYRGQCRVVVYLKIREFAGAACCRQKKVN